MNTIEKMISDNPFPENGRQLNKELILKFQESDDADVKSDCIDKLIKINIRCVSLVKKKYAHSFEYEDLFSLFYDVVESAARGYDFGHDTSDNSFLNYMVVKFRARLATERWRLSSVVRFPMASRETAALVDIGEYSDIIPIYEDPRDSVVSELDELIEKYSEQDLSPEARERLDLLVLSRKFSFKEISEMQHLNIGKSDRYVNTRVHKCIKELIDFKKQCELDDDV